MKLETILVCTDFSELATDALRTAATLAKSTGARLVAVHVFDPPLIFEHEDHAVEDPRGTETEFIAEDVARQKLVDDVAAVAGDDLETATRLETGRVAESLEAAARDEKADLIVMGTHGRRGLARLVLGSVAIELLHVSKIPVLALHPEATSLDSVSRILVPTDFSEASEKARNLVADWGQHFSSKVTLLHVLDRPSSYVYDPLLRDYRPLSEMEKLRNQQGKRLEADADVLRKAGLEVEAKLLQGGAADTIVEQASSTDAGLIVIGARGHTPVGRLLMGSVADRVLRTARCAVLVAPA